MTCVALDYLRFKAGIEQRIRDIFQKKDLEEKNICKIKKIKQ